MTDSMTTPPLDLPALRRDIVSAARCEPGDEVHPWEEVDPDHLIELLDRLEAAERDLAAVTVSRDGWQPRAEAAEKKVAAVREVHPRVVIAVHESHGEEAMFPQCQHHYPCPTITALDTHTPETETTP